MSDAAQPKYAPGKICYLEIPAEDVERSSAFYVRVFGWTLRRRGDGALAFDDTVGQVSGTWVTGRSAVREAGTLVYVMVADAAAACAAIVTAGGSIVHAVDPSEREIWATFRDPAGNLFGVYQQPGL